MKKVAKLVMVDRNDKYLLMYRSNHPAFGMDPDLPGGTVEDGETTHEAMLREVKEEIGVDVDPRSVREVYAGTDYSVHGTYYALFVAKLDIRPSITISWEHSSYEWLDFKDFLQKSTSANDTYMHMVTDTINGI